MLHPEVQLQLVRHAVLGDTLLRVVRIGERHPGAVVRVRHRAGERVHVEGARVGVGQVEIDAVGEGLAATDLPVLAVTLARVLQDQIIAIHVGAVGVEDRPAVRRSPALRIERVEVADDQADVRHLVDIVAVQPPVVAQVAADDAGPR